MKEDDSALLVSLLIYLLYSNILEDLFFENHIFTIDSHGYLLPHLSGPDYLPGGACSHMRSVYYYLWSIRQPSLFPASPCAR